MHVQEDGRHEFILSALDVGAYERYFKLVQEQALAFDDFRRWDGAAEVEDAALKLIQFMARLRSFLTH